MKGMRFGGFGLAALLVMSTISPASAVADPPWDGRTCELAVTPTEPVTNVRVTGLSSRASYPGLKVSEPVALRNLSAAEKRRIVASRLAKSTAGYSTNLVTATAGFLFPCSHSADQTLVSWTEQDGRRVGVRVGDQTGLRFKDRFGNYAYQTGQASQPWSAKTCELAVTATAPITEVFVESDVFMHPGMRVDVPLAGYTGPASTKAWKLLNRRFKSTEEYTAGLAEGQVASWLIPCHLRGEVGPTLIAWRDQAGQLHIYHPKHDTGLPEDKDADGNFAYRIG